MTSPDRIEMELVGDYARKHEYWVKHRRSKNYIARICGTDKKYGYKRVFLDRVRMGRETVYCKDDFTSGVLYEFKSIYYTGSGHPMPEVDGIYRCLGEEDGKLVFELVPNEEVLKELSAGETDTDLHVMELARKLLKVVGDVEIAHKVLDEVSKEAK